MTPHLFVVTPGMLTTVQDLGRPGYQALGVPVCGALDAASLRLANALVGNPEGTGALEIRFVGPTLRVAAPSLRVALAGTATPVEILGGRSIKVDAGRSLTLKRGDVLRVGAVGDTSCCYLAVEGGFTLPAPFGSQSTYDRGGFGGLDGRALRETDRLPLARGAATVRPEVGLVDLSDPDAAAPIRVVLGPQDNYFTEAGIRTLLEAEFTISPQSDRMGLRLDGPTLEHSLGYNILSDGIATGAIQVPGTGKPIVLLADHQTTGGYPKIATVISADLARLGRMRPGHKFGFAAVSVAEAEQARRRQEDDIRRRLAAIAPIDLPREPDTATLLANNLISGVVSIED
jgi:biotin-dependent carboxylase-like uncharacterized protein